MKIALVVGHNARAQGAVRVTDKRTEFDWCGELAKAIRALAPDRYRIVTRTSGAGEIGRAYAEVDRLGVAGSIELHFNSAAAASATGTEVLTSGTRKSILLADQLQARMVRTLGLRNRGLKVIPRHDKNARGYASLWTGTPPAVLIELFFGSNASDCAAADKHFGPAPVLFRSFESDTRHQGDWIWQRYTATSSSGMRFASRSPVA